jgi:RNA polymerase sigma-70 factor (ECF subfamily)
VATEGQTAPQAEVAPDGAEVAAAAAGDPQAFADLVRRTQGPALRVALALTADPALAEDVVQDAYLAVYADLRRADSRFDAARPFLPWLLGAVAHRALSARRARGRRALREWPLDPRRWLGGEQAHLVLPEAASDPDPADPLEAVLRDEGVREVWAAVDRLPPKLRQVAVLRYAGDLPLADIATAVGVPQGTVKSRLAAARRALAGALSAIRDAPSRFAGARGLPEPAG